MDLSGTKSYTSTVSANSFQSFAPFFKDPMNFSLREKCFRIKLLQTVFSVKLVLTTFFVSTSKCYKWKKEGLK